MYERWYGGWLRFRLLGMTGYVVTVVAVFVGRVGSDGWAGLLVVALLPVLFLLVVSPGLARRFDRTRQRSRALGEEFDGRVPGRALRRSGLRQLEVREDDGRLRTMGRSLRHGDHAVIVLPTWWRDLSDDVLDGLLLHEAAHIVRHDTDRSKWTAGLLFAFVWFALPQSAPRPIALPVVLVAISAVIAHNWWQELAADDFVLAHGGPGPADGFARYLIAAQRSPWQQVRSRLTHPPDGWRARRLRAAPSGHDSAAEHGALR